LHALYYSKIVLTVSKNDSFGTYSDSQIYSWHIQNLMQRIQKELENNDENVNNNLCLIFIDPVSSKINKSLTEAYNDLFLNGDRFTHFSTIKDCLHFELSHHSCGIQIADFIAGVTFGYLQEREYSIDVFNRQIRPLIMQCSNDITMGCGIIEIPSNQRVRNFFKS